MASEPDRPVVILLIAAPQTVNTNINWPGLAVSLGTFIASIVGTLAYIDSKQNKRQAALVDRQEALRAEFRSSLDNLAQILSERLETKDNVNQLRIEVARLNEQFRLIAEQRRGPNPS